MSENSNFYSLFGPCEPKNQLVIQTSSDSINQPLSNSTNLIQRPTKRQSCYNTKLFVGNLPLNTTLVEMYHLFSKYGRVNMNLSIVKEDNYAFIHYYDDKEAERACAALNNSLFKNRYIRVQFSTSMGHVNKARSLNTIKTKITQSTTISDFCSTQTSLSSSPSTDFHQNPRAVFQSLSYHDLSTEPFRSNLLSYQTEKYFMLQNYLKQVQMYSSSD
ncbi:non-POU domain-containing octamer-binding [Brachionus plicatilis]|uniref:Non-POU domain-containing octamer-binding n=1 Tax=Brachionus plicatilis TaxID=10195 RepID=A0A3M7SVT6_BRAPC|nr:non-POU domain-containing octamer-binding [Brachionus plicatilis]